MTGKQPCSATDDIGVNLHKLVGVKCQAYNCVQPALTFHEGQNSLAAACLLQALQPGALIEPSCRHEQRKANHITCKAYAGHFRPCDITYGQDL